MFERTTDPSVTTGRPLRPNGSCSCPPTSARPGTPPAAGLRRLTAPPALRDPKNPLVLLPHRLTEITGPLLGEGLITDTRRRPDHAARRASRMGSGSS